MHKTPLTFPILFDLYFVILVARLSSSSPKAIIILVTTVALATSTILVAAAIFVYAPAILIAILPFHFTVSHGCYDHHYLNFEMIHY
ncbi:hypothetical protein CRG98_011593 [Punica granatum]|uniref:Uncharacterized protein n=1 Tax=Punica granatum TaxID=22663 RepID=A0A2I0KHJ5_PUNGR|nr:hypothetical protein CRG98_011593 [Punica granatum]